jgi:hypothetical protein
MYGGLGDAESLGLHETSHYLAPVVAWNLPSDWTVRFSPNGDSSSNAAIPGLPEHKPSAGGDESAVAR